jgi:flap endonuclease-1
MGIKNLMILIKKYAPDSIKQVSINNYKNKTIGIDANLMLYKMVYAIRKNGYDIINKSETTGIDTKITHIHATLLKLYAFRKYNITPLFVFDGIPPVFKKQTLETRYQFRKYMQQKYTQAITQDEKKKYYYLNSDITLDEINDMKSLIKIFGYTYIDAPEEADSQLAYLSKKRKIDAIATDDVDILVFGGSNVLKNFSVAKNKKFIEINLKTLLKSLKITHIQLIDISILIGCDYCKSFKGIGPITAYKYILKYGSIDNIIKQGIIKSTIKYNHIRDYFLYPIAKNINNQHNNKKMLVNLNNLIKLLKKYNYNNEQIKKIIFKL